MNKKIIWQIFVAMMFNTLWLILVTINTVYDTGIFYIPLFLCATAFVFAGIKVTDNTFHLMYDNYDVIKNKYKYPILFITFVSFLILSFYMMLIDGVLWILSIMACIYILVDITKEWDDKN